MFTTGTKQVRGLREELSDARNEAARCAEETSGLRADNELVRIERDRLASRVQRLEQEARNSGSGAEEMVSAGCGVPAEQRVCIYIYSIEEIPLPVDTPSYRCICLRVCMCMCERRRNRCCPRRSEDPAPTNGAFESRLEKQK